MPESFTFQRRKGSRRGRVILVQVVVHGFDNLSVGFFIRFRVSWLGQYSVRIAESRSIGPSGVGRGIS